MGKFGKHIAAAGKRILFFAVPAAMLITGVMSFSRQTKAQGEERPVYHAAMGIQTATQIWIQRWGYFEGSQNEYYNTENYSKLYSTGEVFYDGTFEDVEIAGNGTYTVSLKDADFAGETTVSQLHIATDIPVAESEKLSFTDVTLEINGTEVLRFDEAVMEDEEPYLQGGAVILLYNHWRDALKETLSSMGKGEDSSNGWEVLQGSGSENVSIHFAVSGLPYDREEQAETEEEKEGSGAVLSGTDDEKEGSGAVLSGTDEESAGTPEAASGGESTDASAAKLDQDSTSGPLETKTAGVIVILLSALAVVLVAVVNRKQKGHY